MSRLRQMLRGPRARPGVAAIITLGFAWGIVIHQLGWAQLGHFGQVRAFAGGQAQIDQWHWETNDKAWVDGHFYSVKSPGTAALTTLPYMATNSPGPPSTTSAGLPTPSGIQTASCHSRTWATTSSAVSECRSVSSRRRRSSGP